jgi:hypothetical protein
MGELLLTKGRQGAGDIGIASFGCENGGWMNGRDILKEIQPSYAAANDQMCDAPCIKSPCVIMLAPLE